jgi:hypothetical protein
MRHRLRPLGLLPVAAALVLAACGGGESPAPPGGAAPTDGPTPYLPATTVVTEFGDPVTRDDQRPTYGDTWQTDWGIRLVEFAELDPGGPPRDGIPSIDAPRFVSLADAFAVYDERSPVIQIDVNGDVRAYPLDILIWHEIVNDVVGGVPVAVTYCALCNTAIAYDRRLGGDTFEFGVSGLLRDADLVMYDRTTESLWQQIGGKAIVGSMVGAKLTPLLAPVFSLGQFRDSFPDGLVLARPTAVTPPRPYGTLPAAYRRYASDDAPFLFISQPGARLDQDERVVTIEINGEHVAYSYDLLAERRAVNDTRGGEPLVIFWTPGTPAGADAEPAPGHAGAATGVFHRRLEGDLLTFVPNPDDPTAGAFRDEQTGSVWDASGEAVKGPLAGSRLEPIDHGRRLWFAWSVYEPETTLIEAADLPG